MKNKFMLVVALLVALALAAGELVFRQLGKRSLKAQPPVAVGPGAAGSANVDSLWEGPDSASMPEGSSGDLIRYGRDLIARTAFYFGPGGSIGRQQNGMNCQNCHLDAGRRPWGNNFGGVRSSYPKFKERRGAVENIAQRVSDCFERSMNGVPPDTGSREVRAMIAYMEWLGTGVPKGKKPAGSGIEAIPYLQRPADPAKGRELYILKCQVCHGPQGQGLLDKDGRLYVYPPLWGDHSYNTGASLYRLSRLAGFIFNNMPWGADYRKTQLTAEEAWDLSAFIDSQPRPVKQFRQDWPDISLKPADHPFGPFVDSYPALQHKFGPFPPIVEAVREAKQKKSTK
ncbi:MAG TPA: c-type cytochrome [Puia sp.]|jgi:thiosulfate dehydrogenase|nr:c-type cytochrome [Puia sp.]